MDTFKLIAVSNWKLYQSAHGAGSVEDYISYLARLISDAGEKEESLSAINLPSITGQWEKPDLLIVREKDMEESMYVEFFKRIWEKSRVLSPSGNKPRVIPHTHLPASRQTGVGRIHLPFSLLQKYQGTGELEGMEEIGVSVHSPEEAVIAQKLGATYLTAGHIFATECKLGLPPRGLSYLESVCSSVTIPVYAIGGIHRDNLSQIQQTKASGACMMSEYMCMEPVKKIAKKPLEGV